MVSLGHELNIYPRLKSAQKPIKSLLVCNVDWLTTKYFATVMMTSSNAKIYRVTVRGIHRWPVDSPHKGQWRGAFIFTLISAWTKGWTQNRDTCDLRRHGAHYDVTVVESCGILFVWWQRVFDFQCSKAQWHTMITDDCDLRQTPIFFRFKPHF